MEQGRHRQVRPEVMMMTHYRLRNPATNEIRTVTGGKAAGALHAAGWKVIELW